MTLQQLGSFPSEVFHPPSFAYPQFATYRTGARKSRQRGVVLTEHGWRKLLEANVLQKPWGEWHAYQELSDWTLLSPRTVSKIVGREVGVDRRSLKQFFDTFDLPWESSDYRLVSEQSVSVAEDIGLSLMSLDKPVILKLFAECVRSHLGQDLAEFIVYLQQVY